MELTEWVYENLYDFYENEVKYTRSVYDALGVSDEVLTFLEYNANKALANLGLQPMFPTTVNDVNPIIINGLSESSVVHDFFSQVGNSYFMGEVEATTDNDYNLDFISQ